MKHINKKAVTAIIVSTIFSFGVFSSWGNAQKQTSAIKISINGDYVATPKNTHVFNNQVMLPLRWVCEKLNETSIQWDSKTRTVHINTNAAFTKLQKLSSYVHGLTSDGKEDGKWPVPKSVNNLTFPKMPGSRKLGLNHTSNKTMITISINGTPFAVYDYEFHNNLIYITSDQIENLLHVRVGYNSKENKLSIYAMDEKTIDAHIQKIEETITPTSPEEALKLWGRGEQVRSAALQYAALSPKLRKEAENNIAINHPYWVTGGSSPWMKGNKITEQKKISETAVEYTVSYLEATSSGNMPAMEKLVVEKININGKQGWYVTKLIYGKSYYTVIPPEEENY